MNKSKQKGEAMVIALGIVVVLFTFFHNYTLEKQQEAFDDRTTIQEETK